MHPAPLRRVNQPPDRPKVRERQEGFVAALGRRLACGRKLADEVIRDVQVAAPEGEAEPRQGQR